MQQRFTIAVDAPPERVFPLVADLKHYPELLDIVHGVTLEPGETSDDDAPSWTVTLRAKLGPLARSKRLRMERTTHEPVSSVRFERRERDGRDHSDWTLEATVRPTEAGTTVTMTLDYGGRLWTAALKGGAREPGCGRPGESAAPGRPDLGIRRVPSRHRYTRVKPV